LRERGEFGRVHQSRQVAALTVSAARRYVAAGRPGFAGLALSAPPVAPSEHSIPTITVIFSP
jgi:hypothetical protein